MQTVIVRQGPQRNAVQYKGRLYTSGDSVEMDDVDAERCIDLGLVEAAQRGIPVLVEVVAQKKKTSAQAPLVDTAFLLPAVTHELEKIMESKGICTVEDVVACTPQHLGKLLNVSLKKAKILIQQAEDRLED